MIYYAELENNSQINLSNYGFLFALRQFYSQMVLRRKITQILKGQSSTITMLMRTKISRRRMVSKRKLSSMVFEI